MSHRYNKIFKHCKNILRKLKFPLPTHTFPRPATVWCVTLDFCQELLYKCMNCGKTPSPLN